MTENTTPTATAHDEFRVKDSGGDDVAIIDMTNGNMYIDGQLHDEEGALDNPASDDFITST